MSEATSDIRAPNDVRPVIATGSSGNWGLYAFLGVLAIGGVVLFSALSASRQAANDPSVSQPAAPASARIASPEPLQVPERFFGPRSRGIAAEGQDPSPRPTLRPLQQAQQAQQPPVRVTQIRTNPAEVPPVPPSAPITREPVSPPPVSQVIFESRSPAAPVQVAATGQTSSDRVRASRLANPSRTIPQGTVIPAVLETALDSTQGGGARALVQRDVSSFDGTRVLIPRGSRLYGEYEASLQPGQNRALVQWTRLIRPDGVTIALDSPSSDPLGRAGVRGKVDSKFFQRFGNALLQSVLDIGVGLATNAAADGVIVALPGSTQTVQVTEQQSIRPTLKVRHGTSVSVFVARDLDFSSVDP
jgi:type IV secretion system protein VirB10